VEDEYMQMNTQMYNNIKQMTYNFNQITQLTQQVGGDKDTQELRDQLTRKIEATKTIAKDTNNLIKRIGQAKPTNAQEMKDKKGVVMKITKDFEIFDEKFKALAKTALDRMASVPVKTKAIEPRRGYMEDEDEDEQRSFIESSRRQEQYLAVENDREWMDNMIEERDQEIKTIQSQMSEVNDIFKDLHQLVTIHEDMIDNIETNISVAKSNTGRAVVEVKKASDYQQKSRSKLCLFLIIVTLILAVVAAIVVFTQLFGKKDK
jgi:syntaxin 7